MVQNTHPAIIVLTGASGAGKTTLIEELSERDLPGVECINCDRVKLPGSSDTSDGQAEVLRYWVGELRSQDERPALAVLDTQIRPHVAIQVLAEMDVRHWRVVLVDCDTVLRNERLVRLRKQPELSNPQMDGWAAYLRGQTDALGLPRIDTTDGEGIEQLVGIIKELMAEARAN